MFVRGACTHDARVLKEARTLAGNGYEVTIFAVLEPGTARVEDRDGFRIIRVPNDPLHFKVLRALGRAGDIFQGYASSLLRPRRATNRRPAGLSVGRHDGADGTSSAGPAGPAPASAQGVPQGIKVPPWLPESAKAALFWAHHPLALLDHALRALWAARRTPADVFHAHDLNALPPAFLLAKLRHRKLIYDSHELNLEAGRWATIRGWPKRLLRRYEGFLVRRANAVITVNDSLADHLSSWYGIPRPTVVMNCPEPVTLPVNDSLLHRKLGLSPETPLVLYQGGLTAGRGLPELLVSFAQVEGAIGVFMGSGNLRPELETLARQQGLSDRVRFLDPVPQEELLAHTASARVGVVSYQATSLNNYLATPNKIFEYVMAGVPVAASDFPEMARIVRQDDLGELFDPDDPTSIAGAINRLLRRPDYEEVRARAERLGRTRYSWTRESKHLLSVYRSLRLPDTQGRREQATRAAST